MRQTRAIPWHDQLVFEMSRGHQPLHVRLRNALREIIIDGHVEPGERLPSSRLLAHELEISRTTTHNAYQELIAQGFIETRPRSGLYVASAVTESASVATQNPRNPELPAIWSRKVGSEQPSVWPHLDRLANWRDYEFPFVTGQVDHTLFPVSSWLSASRKALSERHLPYSLDDRLSDDPLLLEQLCQQILPSRGIRTTAGNIVITLGSQEGLQLIVDLILSPGDVAVVENPGYLDVRHILSRAGARIVPVDVDANGLMPQAHYRGAKLMFLTPSHQHPTNVTLSVERRTEILKQAHEQDFIVVEDDYDSELRYRGSPSPAIASIDDGVRTFYVGTFSKFLAPGLRLGFVVAPIAVADIIRQRRRYRHRQLPGHTQRALAILLQSGDYQRYLRKVRSTLARRWDIGQAAVTKYFPENQALPPGAPASG